MNKSLQAHHTPHKNTCVFLTLPQGESSFLLFTRLFYNNITLSCQLPYPVRIASRLSSVAKRFINIMWGLSWILPFIMDPTFLNSIYSIFPFIMELSHSSIKGRIHDKKDGMFHYLFVLLLRQFIIFVLWVQRSRLSCVLFENKANLQKLNLLDQRSYHTTNFLVVHHKIILLIFYHNKSVFLVVFLWHL